MYVGSSSLEPRFTHGFSSIQDPRSGTDVYLTGQANGAPLTLVPILPTSIRYSFGSFCPVRMAVSVFHASTLIVSGEQSNHEYMV